MTATINGIQYNTETAESIAYFWCGLHSPKFFIEHLFRDGSGRLFIEEKNEYAHSIIPVSLAEAKEWAKLHISHPEDDGVWVDENGFFANV